MTRTTLALGVLLVVAALSLAMVHQDRNAGPALIDDRNGPAADGSRPVEFFSTPD